MRHWEVKLHTFWCAAVWWQQDENGKEDNEETFNKKLNTKTYVEIVYS